MTALFRRDYVLEVADLRITALDIAFDVLRNLSKEPNTADIRIRNLNEDHRARLQAARSATVALWAGYRRPRNTIVFGDSDDFSDTLSIIYKGELREVWTEQNTLTRVTSGDGERKQRRARVQKSLRKGSLLKPAIEACVDALGVGVGNLASVVGLELKGSGKTFPKGTAVSGQAAEELDKLLKSAGLTYSIQNGTLQVLRPKQTLDGATVVLSPDTGMLGSPSVSSDGTIRARTLIIPDLVPGRRVEFRSEAVKGDAKVLTARYTGDTAAQQWSIAIECRRLS